MKDKDRFNSWIFAIGGEIIGLNNEFIFQQRRVCHAHFENKFHCRNNRLSNNAIPTLNLRGKFHVTMIILGFNINLPFGNTNSIKQSSNVEFGELLFTFIIFYYLLLST